MPKRNRFARPVLSATTILILSGFLIGLTVGRVVGEDLSPYVLSCGLAGCLAFMAFDVAGTRREEDAVAEEKRQAEERLDKHVLSLSSIGFTLPPQEDEEARLSDEELQNVLDAVEEEAFAEESTV
ncbi:MAG: hypothetical protein R3C18_10630 [Planctomycetaceae bacterium]